jgi:hypothetical protein
MAHRPSEEGELPGKISTITSADLEWDFRGELPTYRVKGPTSKYGSTNKVDPFPCYSHSADLVLEMATFVESCFPIKYPVDYYLLTNEDAGRTNGYAHRDMLWGTGAARYDGWEPAIILSGKRIPPHPAMTRYLVAHEYGHVVQWWIEWVRGIEDKSTTVLDEEYMLLRPGCDNEYGGRRWHSNVGELFANDFRILVAGVEPEFWPHPGFPHPHHCPEVEAFWRTALASHRFHGPDPA